MKLATALILAASVGLAAAQIIVEASGLIRCKQPLAGAFCVGDSLVTKTIATCDANGIGQRGLCNEFLAGKPPYGSNDAVCYQTSDTAGDAACVKDHVVYDSSGNPKFTLGADAFSATSTASDFSSLTTVDESTASTVLTSSVSTTSAESSASTALQTLSTSPCPFEPGNTVTPGVPATPIIGPVPIPPISGPPLPLPSGEPIPPPPPPPPAASVPPAGGDSDNSTFSIPTTLPTASPVLSVPVPVPTANIPTVPTSAAPALKQAAAVMVAVGMAVVCLL